ncbi:hypothetical protein [Rhodopila globiformis]|uniref:Uncharacterized protein n=1 Tax=Rhodopila globiformis TaxID=1071 RepID=A0A2S6MTU7_RHOGL|nr:hypothetical protein [Rhodopila globiformis]PPQ25790.1 hypothetical protein CCS01_32000 [Rhodopila globiformis]
MSCLLSSHGTLLCRDRNTGILLHRKLTASFDNVDLLEVDDASRLLCPNFGHYMRDDVSVLRLDLEQGPLAGWTVTRSADQRSLTLSRDGHWLMAQADTEALSRTADGTSEAAWFLPINLPDLAVVNDLLAGRWLVQSADTGMPQGGTLLSGFRLSVGTLAIDLRWNLPFDRSEWPHRLPVLRDGWRIDKLCRYRPLIYYTAFNAPAIMHQFALSLASLVTVGAYGGAIVVITDKPPGEIGALAPPGMREPLAVLPMAACDRFAAIGARLTISGWADAGQFQPLLYVDTDVVFDLPVAPMLWALARSDRISVPAEPKEKLASSVFVGSGLFRDDNCDPGGGAGLQLRDGGHPQPAGARPDLGPDRPDHVQPGRDGRPRGAALRRSGDRQLCPVSPGEGRYRPDEPLRPPGGRHRRADRQAGAGTLPLGCGGGGAG